MAFILPMPGSSQCQSIDSNEGVGDLAGAKGHGDGCCLDREGGISMLLLHTTAHALHWIAYLYVSGRGILMVWVSSWK